MKASRAGVKRLKNLIREDGEKADEFERQGNAAQAAKYRLWQRAGEERLRLNLEAIAKDKS